MGSIKGTLTSWLAQGISARLIGQYFRPGVMGNKEGWKLLLLQGKSHLKLAKVQFWKQHQGKLFLFIFTGPRSIQDGSWDAFLLKVWSWQGFAGHSFLFGLLSGLGRGDALIFSFPPRLLGLAFSLSREGDARLVLSSYSYWLRTSGCCLGAQERKWREWLKKKSIRWGRQIFFFKKENELSKDCASKDNVSNAPSPLV